ncbi:hypothetical protein PG996_000354 [Apiospora saccharicola]|uniref:Aminoglycoside phosphotransferase domain-containing protein n=1 Tax=Apiospora saccharicola TaxID=335842 RepID=A0ABR1WHL6_9PEZI
MESYCLISAKSLPSGSSVTFKNTSYFSRNGQNVDFPTPSRILAESAIQAPSFQDCEERPPVYFKELGLVVKFGKEPKVNIAEAQCLWALKQVVPHVPVPEVYGWTQDTKYTYLFIEFVHAELRTLQQEPDDRFPGHVNRGPLTDVVFTGGNLPPAGPFFSVTAFHDWLSSMLTKDKGQHWLGIDPSDIPDPYRQGLPDDSSVVFTHPDLHPSNIIVFTESPPRIVAIIDWQQSGWYPDYWEFCKAEYTAEPRSEWVTEYIPRFVDEPKCVEAFELYSRAFGPSICSNLLQRSRELLPSTVRLEEDGERRAQLKGNVAGGGGANIFRAKPLTNPAIFFASQTHKPNFKLLLAYSLYLIRMERLPQEVVARIAGYLSRIHEGKLIRPSLATLSGSWQYAIEALTFQSLQLTSDHLEVFVAALANGRTRRRFLRSLCLDIILPRYSDEDCARYETADDRAANNHVFSHHLSALLQELSQWPGGGKLNLCIDMHSPMDGAHRGPDRFDHARILRRRRTERGGSGGTGPIDAHAQRRGGARRRGLRVPLSPAGRGHAPPADGPRAPARPHAVASERLPRGDAAAGQGGVALLVPGARRDERLG